MSRRLEEDLERWETGTLSLAEIEERHPGQVRGLIELHRDLSTLAMEATPDPRASWGRLGSRLPERTRDPVLTYIPRRGRRRGLTRRRLAVLGLAAVLMLTGGLAAAGVLPAPVQDAIANVAGHLGLHVPPADLPKQTTHGNEVSHTARSTPAEGCEKGARVSEVASSRGRTHSRGTADDPNPCLHTHAHQPSEQAGEQHVRGNPEGTGAPSGVGSGSAPRGGSATGSPHVRGPGVDRRATHGPPGHSQPRGRSH